MRKYITVVLVIVACIAITAAGSFIAGRVSGIRHAIEDSAVFVIEYSDDMRTFKVVEDMEVWIALDEDLYTHQSSFSAR